MKIKLTNTRKVEKGKAYDKGTHWTYGYVFNEGEMMFWKRSSICENFNDCATETYKECWPYAGAMNPRMFFSFRVEPIRMGVVGIDENGVPFVFYTRHYKASRCPGMWEVDYDEVSDLKIVKEG